jgi:HEAT repeat protein
MTLKGEDRANAIEGLLWAATNEKHYHPKCWAVMALSRFPDSPDAMRALQVAAGDQHKDVKATAAIALGLSGEKRFATELKTLAARNKGTPVQYAAQLGIGLLRDRGSVSWYLLDFEFAENPLQYSAMSYGMAQSMEDDQAALLFRLVRSDDVFTREAAVKTLGMIGDLKPESRREISALLASYESEKKAERRSFGEDPLTSFYAGVVRAALGDRNALNAVAEAMLDRGFYLEFSNEVSWSSVMDPLNDRLPVHYRVRPFHWSDTD